MGSYCRYCDHRCFVERIVPDTGAVMHMATCERGKAHDRRASGFDADTAVNARAIATEVHAVSAERLPAWTIEALIARERTIATLRRTADLQPARAES